jgi:hypothetical protein
MIRCTKLVIRDISEFAARHRIRQQSESVFGLRRNMHMAVLTRLLCLDGVVSLHANGIKSTGIDIPLAAGGFRTARLFHSLVSVLLGLLSTGSIALLRFLRVFRNEFNVRPRRPPYSFTPSSCVIRRYSSTSATDTDAVP